VSGRPTVSPHSDASAPAKNASASARAASVAQRDDVPRQIRDVDLDAVDHELDRHGELAVDVYCLPCGAGGREWILKSLAGKAPTTTMTTMSWTAEAAGIRRLAREAGSGLRLAAGAAPV